MRVAEVSPDEDVLRQRFLMQGMNYVVATQYDMDRRQFEFGIVSEAAKALKLTWHREAKSFER